MVELQTLARPYARAAFAAAREDRTITSWAESLVLLVAVAEHDKVNALLNSPALAAAQKSAALVQLLGESADSKVGNFLNILAQNKRLKLLPTIKTMFFDLKNNFEKSVEVEITTAYEISDAVRIQLINALQRKLEREIALSTTVDAGLMGGAFIRAGDTVIDGSIRGRLAKLAEAMTS